MNICFNIMFENANGDTVCDTVNQHDLFELIQSFKRDGVTPFVRVLGAFESYEPSSVFETVIREAKYHVLTVKSDGSVRVDGESAVVRYRKDVNHIDWVQELPEDVVGIAKSRVLTMTMNQKQWDHLQLCIKNAEDEKKERWARQAQIIDAQKRKADAYDAVYNEGCEGFNPYRDHQYSKREDFRLDGQDAYGD